MTRRLIIAGALLGMLGCLFQLTLQFAMRSHATNGLYQVYSSEAMMQTVSIEDLRNEPLQTLLHLHSQPPALDLIRAVLARVWASADLDAMARRVDQSLYVLWALLSGLMVAVIFWWLAQITTVRYAAFATIFFIPHPGAIFYVTFLESTFLSATLVLWTYYLLWRLRDNPGDHIFPFTLGVIALFFTRSLFQLPAIALFAVCLMLFSVRHKRVLVFLLVAGGVAGTYVSKQYYLFNTLSTSGTAGLNLCRAIGVPEYQNGVGLYVQHIDTVHLSEEQEQSLPSVLVRKRKLDGSANLGHISFLQWNNEVLEYCEAYLRRMPLLTLARSYIENARIYFMPSSRYTTAHVIVDRMPWRRVYDRIFSFPVLPALLVFAGVTWAAGKSWRELVSGIALALPGFYIVLASVLFEKGENMRLKFILEPVLYVFIAAQVYAAWLYFYQKYGNGASFSRRDRKT